MPFVNISKDLNTVKTKVAFNLTKRQLICFGTAVVTGIPLYIFTRVIIGTSAAALLMIGVMLPFFFLAMYEKDGLPAEKILRNYIRARLYRPMRRTYQTENLYDIISKEGKVIATENKTTAATPVGKRQAGKKQPGRFEKHSEE